MQAELCSDLCFIGIAAIIFFFIAPQIAHRRAIKDPGMFLLAGRGAASMVILKTLLYEFHPIEQFETLLFWGIAIMILATISQISFKSIGVSRR